MRETVASAEQAVGRVTDSVARRVRDRRLLDVDAQAQLGADAASIGARAGGVGPELVTLEVSGKRASATSTLPNLIPPAAWPSPAVAHPSPTAVAPPPGRAWNMCQMNGLRVRGLTPLIAMRKRRPHPAMARSGQAGASARMIASAISCAQWFVASVTGAAGLGQTIVPCLAITRTGRKVPEFLGVRGSMR